LAIIFDPGKTEQNAFIESQRQLRDELRNEEIFDTFGLSFAQAGSLAIRLPTTVRPHSSRRETKGTWLSAAVR